MYLVGGAEHHRIRNCERMRDTLEESGYESDGAGTFIPDIRLMELKGDFLIYVGKDGKRDMLAASHIGSNEYFIMTCRGGLVGLESTIINASMPALLQDVKNDERLKQFYEPLTRFF